MLLQLHPSQRRCRHHFARSLCRPLLILRAKDEGVSSPTPPSPPLQRHDLLRKAENVELREARRSQESDTSALENENGWQLKYETPAFFRNSCGAN